MISSVMVYNLKNNIREDDLMHLLNFVAYGTLEQRRDDDTSHAFQVSEAN